MSAPVVHAAVYDLRVPGAWDVARRHARVWGRLYTDVHPLDPDHIALVFRPAPNERWRDWERSGWAGFWTHPMESWRHE